MVFLALDTNIYRELGLDIENNHDYDNLKGFISLTEGEFYLFKTVKDELIDYCKNEIIFNLRSKYIKIQQDIKRNPFIKEDITFSNIDNYFEQAIKAFEASIKRDKLEYHVDTISTNILIDFLLQNKRVAKKDDSTRDLIILIITQIGAYKKYCAEHCAYDNALPAVGHCICTVH